MAVFNMALIQLKGATIVKMYIISDNVTVTSCRGEHCSSTKANK